MGIIVKPHTLAGSAIIYANQLNANYDTLFNEVNGNLDNANIKASAGIEGSKVASKPSGISTSQLNANSVTGTELLSNGSDDALRAVNSDHIKNDVLIQRHFTNNCVGTAELIDGNVTTVKILDANVTHAKLKLNSVDVAIGGTVIASGFYARIALGVNVADKKILGGYISRAGIATWAGQSLIYTLQVDSGTNQLYLNIYNPGSSTTIAASTTYKLLYVEN